MEGLRASHAEYSEDLVDGFKDGDDLFDCATDTCYACFSSKSAAEGSTVEGRKEREE
ncbi:hypothetical protein PtrM4_119000 [Pyrenophora tritici-repentis]|uniref:Uncharacterized protein n=1 Tax=Pyrenophora tritici-repentis TaxID=45151 RepID=A0A834VMS4_9PLEO|nr:hypothetical protein PtrM4_119000 [Pyrenophora tritici-repentis]KAI1568198.1 hypothetical protein PtrEW4_006569 [Pyrenophora tritici-repentis]